MGESGRPFRSARRTASEEIVASRKELAAKYETTTPALSTITGRTMRDVLEIQAVLWALKGPEYFPSSVTFGQSCKDSISPAMRIPASLFSHPAESRALR
jgi:hypothetical protein